MKVTNMQVVVCVCVQFPAAVHKAAVPSTRVNLSAE